MKYYIYAIGAIFCWASLPAATGSGLSGLNTDELMFFSFTSAAIFLYLQDVLLHRSFKLNFPGFKASLLGIWGIFFYHFVYFQALKRAPLAEGAILATTWSFWIVVFSCILQFKKLKISIVTTALIGMFGAALVIASGKNLSFDSMYLHGYMLALLCGLIWASFSVALGKVKIKKEPMTVFTLYAAILSAIFYFSSAPHNLPSAGSLAAAIYLGCIPLGLSFFLWNRAVTGGNLVVIGYLSYLTPPLAVMLVALIHHENVSNQVIAGMAVIIGASIGGRLSLPSSRR